jgi:hypothetical protein
LTSGAAIGPLHGVPAAIKDLFDFKPGWPATFGGIRALRDFKLDAYCAFAERAERAGAILVGKGNSPVMGFRGVCDNPLFGASRNPFDTTKNTGGSSGGCAGAVADGLLTFAEGDGRGRLDPDPGLVVRDLWLQAVVRPRADDLPAQRVRRHRPVPVRGAAHPHRGGRRARPDRHRRLRRA